MTESTVVSRRLLTALVLAVLAAVGLTACRSNVGTAATIQGKQVTDSTVSGYMTANSQPVRVQTQTGFINAAPRVYVLETLIDDQLYSAIMKATPLGEPSKGVLAQALQKTLGGKSPAAFARRAGLKGYTNRFANLYAQAQAKLNVLIAYRDRNVDLQSALSKTKFKVSVAPRYGKWHADSLSILSANPYDSLPGYIKLQPVPASSAP